MLCVLCFGPSQHAWSGNKTHQTSTHKWMINGVRKSGIKPGDYDEEGGHDEDDNEEEDAEDLSQLGLG